MIALMLGAFFLARRELRSPSPTAQAPTPPLAPSDTGQAPKPEPNVALQVPTAVRREIKNSETKVSPGALSPVPQLGDVLSHETARKAAWLSMPHGWKDIHELDPDSEFIAPSSENQRKRFRGFVGGDRILYAELRVESGKWIFAEGNDAGSLIPRPPREVYPYHGQSDVWTLYYADSQRLFLKHFAKVKIPELNGEFELLSGWLLDETHIWFVGMIATDAGWPPKELFSRLIPEKPQGD